MKNLISNIFAILWFFGILLETLFFTILMCIGILFFSIIGMLKSGSSLGTLGFAYLAIASFIFSITGWVPTFRKCYYKLPWLYPFSMMALMNLFNLSLEEIILSKGFQVINPLRHIITIIIMIIQITVCRLIMCIYFKKNPMVLYKYDKI